jgi:hypothetical protein
VRDLGEDVHGLFGDVGEAGQGAGAHEHRMACAKCDFYLPKNSSKAQLLEAKANLRRMLVAIPLTDDERAAVDDGQEALDKLLERLADTPTPAGATPRDLACGSAEPPLLQILPGPPA